MSTMRLSLGNYEAWIKVEGQEVEHYAVEVNEAEKRVTCWIASEQGKHFSINALKKHDYFDCGAFPSLDGRPVDGLALLRRQVNAPKSISSTASGKHNIRHFVFSALELTDDDSLLDTSVASRHIGEIEVQFCVVTNLQPEKERSSFWPAPTTQKLHERSKKAMAHQIQYGPEINTTIRQELPCTACDVVATFIFRYRSFDMLQANGIAPRGPPPAEVLNEDSSNSTPGNSLSRKRKTLEIKEEDDDDVEEDPDETEEKRKEAEYLAGLEQIKKARKARKQEKPPKKKVKRQFQPAFLPGEVIDLT